MVSQLYCLYFSSAQSETRERLFKCCPEKSAKVYSLFLSVLLDVICSIWLYEDLSLIFQTVSMDDGDAEDDLRTEDESDDD
jgi:hypothetical protein